MQRLSVNARRLHYKPTRGLKQGWRRSRLGGNRGSHFHAWSTRCRSGIRRIWRYARRSHLSSRHPASRRPFGTACACTCIALLAGNSPRSAPRGVRAVALDAAASSFRQRAGTGAFAERPPRLKPLTARVPEFVYSELGPPTRNALHNRKEKIRRELVCGASDPICLVVAMNSHPCSSQLSVVLR
jgi:hypothetical protein